MIRLSAWEIDYVSNTRSSATWPRDQRMILLYFKTLTAAPNLLWIYRRNMSRFAPRYYSFSILHLDLILTSPQTRLLAFMFTFSGSEQWGIALSVLLLSIILEWIRFRNYLVSFRVIYFSLSVYNVIRGFVRFRSLPIGISWAFRILRNSSNQH